MARITVEDYIDYVNEWGIRNKSIDLDGYRISVSPGVVEINASNSSVTVVCMSFGFHYLIHKVAMNGETVDRDIPVSNLLGRISPVKNARIN